MLSYIDSSVVLAHLLDELHRPPADFWDGGLIASRLLEYEVRVRLHSYGHASTAGEATDRLLARLGLVALDPDVLSRALTPFPVPLRTLDALHIDTADHLRRVGTSLVLATYDRRMAVPAAALGFSLHPTVRPLA